MRQKIKSKVQGRREREKQASKVNRAQSSESKGKERALAKEGESTKSHRIASETWGGEKWL